MTNGPPDDDPLRDRLRNADALLSRGLPMPRVAWARESSRRVARRRAAAAAVVVAAAAGLTLFDSSRRPPAVAELADLNTRPARQVERGATEAAADERVRDELMRLRERLAVLEEEVGRLRAEDEAAPQRVLVVHDPFEDAAAVMLFRLRRAEAAGRADEVAALRCRLQEAFPDTQAARSAAEVL